MTSTGEMVLDAWATSNRVTQFLVEGIPAKAWPVEIPGTPRKTIRMMAAHLHNSRCGWIRTLGSPFGVKVPARVDKSKVTQKQLVKALGISGRGIGALLELGLEHGGVIPPTRIYVWRNLPTDVGHVLAYFVAHEGHHRGQLMLAARQLGHRVPAEIGNGLWNWTRLSKGAR